MDTYKSQINLNEFYTKQSEALAADTEKKPMNKKKIKTVSLFTGCGGLDLGFLGGFKYRNKLYSKNSFDIVLANDFDPAATLVYEKNKNYFRHEMQHGDVSEISNDDIPEFDFLLAGFPCQPFSNAGLRKGVNDEKGSLFAEAIRIFQSSVDKGNKPLGFLFENVRGIMSSKMEDGTTVPDEIIKRMEAMGYSTNYQLLNASEYGVPSNRYRLIIIGLRKDIGYFDYSTLTQIVKKYKIPNSKNDPYELLLGSILSDIPKSAPQKDDYWAYSPSGQHMVDCIGPCIDGSKALNKFKKNVSLDKISETINNGKSWKNMPYEQMSDRFRKIWDNPQKYRAPNFYRRFALGEINGTITASAQPENCGITHPFLNRRFTVREAARIQSFPDSFTFPYKTIANAYKVIGNAVPPIFSWVLARGIQETLKDVMQD